MLSTLSRIGDEIIYTTDIFYFITLPCFAECD